jgi:GNAT superfamily N-acetyltransferase
MEIRTYNHLNDLESITELMSDLGYPTSIEMMTNRMKKIKELSLYHTFVALIDKKIVGMVGCRDVFYYEDDGFVTQISLLVTKKEYQKQGIGRALVTFVEEWASKKGSNGLFLTSGIKPEREKAHKFYKDLGFDVNGYRFVKKIK